MSIPELKTMLEAGIHFGHQTLRWNPKMRKYILAEKNGIHIIDLKKTQECLKLALQRINKTLKAKKSILFVGTKKSVKHCIKEEAERAKMYFVTERWLGGMLTNFTTVRQSIKTLEDIEATLANDKIDLKKKEKVALDKKRKKLEAVLGGIRKMAELPGIVYIADTKSDHIAVKETRRLNIPTIAIVDTNSNPEEVTIPIPGNDDAIKSVSLITKQIADAVIEFSEGFAKEEASAAQKETEKNASSDKSESEEKPGAQAESSPAVTTSVQTKSGNNPSETAENNTPEAVSETPPSDAATSTASDSKPTQEN